MNNFTAIDLSQLSAPNVLEALDFEAILAKNRAIFLALAPEFASALEIESEPINKLLQVLAYDELILRQCINDAARARMLAYASGADLEHIAVNYNLVRRVVDPGNALSVPPLPPVYEDDNTLRQRCLLAMEGLSNAGTLGSYAYHAMSSDVRVKDVSVSSPIPGHVAITVLSSEGDGTSAAEVLAAVLQTVSADHVRALCDHIAAVQSASIQPYHVDAVLSVYAGPDAEVVLRAATASVQRYVEAQHCLGVGVNLSGLYAALHQQGVYRVTLLSPVADMICTSGQAAFCTGINLSLQVVD